ncbi:hypothetical protein ABPG74_014666 [Tetrahymena malaccensis]
MLKIRKAAGMYLLAFILFGCVQTAEKNRIQTACTFNSNSTKLQEGCIELKKNQNQQSKFIKINSQCNCTNSFMNILNKTINLYDTSIVLPCDQSSQLEDENKSRLRYSQEQCQSSEECLSGNCNQILGICEGQKLGQSCSVYEQLFCDPELICDQKNNTCIYPNQLILKAETLKKNTEKKMLVQSIEEGYFECESSFQCRQNEFCHIGKCFPLMSLEEGQTTDFTENNLFRVGNSIVDLRCKNLLSQNNTCSKINQFSQDTLIKKCSDSKQCTDSRRCDLLWDSSMEFYKQTKYNFLSHSFCQVFPDNFLFVENLKSTYINTLIEQNELCPLNFKLQSKCSKIRKSLENLEQLVLFIDNYHIIKNTCIKHLQHLFNVEAFEFMNQYENQQEQIQNSIRRHLQSDQQNEDNKNNTNSSPNPDQPKQTEDNNGNTNNNSGNTNSTNTNSGNQNNENTNNNSNTNNDKNQNNSNNDNSNNGNQQEKPGDKESSDSGSSNTGLIVVLIVIVLVFGCCGAVIYVRRRNDSGFASLTAQLEKDKQVMIKKGGGMMSMGSGSMNNNKAIANSTDSSGNIQGKQIHNDEMQIVDQKKFSKRVINDDVRLPSQQKEAQVQLKNVNNNGGVELHLEQNNGHEYQDKSDKAKHHAVHRPHAQHPHSSNSVPTSGIPSQQHPGAQSQNQKAQDMEQQKNLDTSVQNNFFSIDGEDEEKHDKIMDSIQLDYQSDDTTYSNVFNLEGEESSKPHSNRKKKKKQKQQNHLFFDDKNEE